MFDVQQKRLPCLQCLTFTRFLFLYFHIVNDLSDLSPSLLNSRTTNAKLNLVIQKAPYLAG